MPWWTSSGHVGKEEQQTMVIKWEAGDNYFIHCRKDGEPQYEEGAENMPQRRTDVASPVWSPLEDDQASPKDTPCS